MVFSAAAYYCSKTKIERRFKEQTANFDFKTLKFDEKLVV